MTRCKMRFRFTFLDKGIMETTHIGEPSTTKAGAESNCWMAMAKNNFERFLIASTIKIEKLDFEFLEVS